MKSLILLIALLLCSCASYKPQGYITYVKSNEVVNRATLQLKLPSGPVVFLGKADLTDNSGGGAQMMYPGYNAAGFLAAIFTHAAISGSVQNKQKTDRQNLANKVLEPYRLVIEKLSNPALMDDNLSVWQPNEVAFSLARFDAAKKYRQDEIILECLPAFILSANEETLVLRTTVAFYHVGQEKNPIYQNQIEVFSDRLVTDKPREYWLNENGAEFTVAVKWLFAESMRIAVDDAFTRIDQAPRPDENFKYVEGTEIGFERGSRVGTSENRILIRTLRGWLKSIPINRLTLPLSPELALE